MLEYVLSFLILAGAVFTFIGSLGLARLRDFYTRLHGPTKATTLGVGSLLIASSIYFSGRGEGLSLHEVLVTLFLFITAPVSAHLLAKAALHLGNASLAALPPATPPPAAPPAVAPAGPGQSAPPGPRSG
jgi:multicomponent K+:H+ antiporter subunit G